MQTKGNYQFIDMLSQKMRAKVRPDDSGDRSIIGKVGDIVEGTFNGIHGYQGQEAAKSHERAEGEEGNHRAPSSSKP